MQSKRQLNVLVSGHSDIGKQKRDGISSNEDSFFIDEDNYIYVVADGLGGRGQGDVASMIAARTIAAEVRDVADGLRMESYQADEIEERVSRAIRDVNTNLLHTLARHSKRYRNFGTTLALVLYHNGSIHVFTVGDSMVFHYGTLDNPLWRGIFPVTYAHRSETNGFAANYFLGQSKGMITQYLGKSEIDICYGSSTMKPGDTVLLATDGLTDTVHPAEMKKIIEEKPLPQIPPCLIELANNPIMVPELVANYTPRDLAAAKAEIGGKDNITVIALQFQESGTHG